MAKAAELDDDLVAGLKAAKSKRAYFALVLKGSNDGALIISKTKVPPAAITEAKKKSGGSTTLKGFCKYEEGTYFFETAKQAPATAAQAVKTIAKRDAGLAVKAEFRVSNDAELAAEEGEAASEAVPKAAPTPPPGGDAVIKRFHALTADIQAALRGPNDARVKTLFAAIRDQIQKKDFADATKNIDELEALVKPGKAEAATPPNGADLMKRLNAMTPEIKECLNGPSKARIQPLFVAVAGQIKNKEFAEAAKSLDKLQQMIDSSKGDGPPRGKAANANGLEAAMSAWTAARTTALTQLAKLANAIKASGHPKAADGFKMLELVIKKQITARPDNANQVAELVRYIQSDEIFTDVEKPNPFGVTVSVRQPLLKAL